MLYVNQKKSLLLARQPHLLMPIQALYSNRGLSKLTNDLFRRQLDGSTLHPRIASWARRVRLLIKLVICRLVADWSGLQYLASIISRDEPGESMSKAEHEQQGRFSVKAHPYTHMRCDTVWVRHG